MKTIIPQTEHLLALCRGLKLPAVGRDAERMAVESERQKVGPLEYLIGLLETEADERFVRRTQRRTNEAGFPIVKTLEGFDFSRTPHLPESLIRRLAEGEYIANAEPILFIGEPDPTT